MNAMTGQLQARVAAVTAVNSVLIAIGLVLCNVTMATAGAEKPSEVALGGVVTSKIESQMEGVLVSAKRVGSTVTTTVVTDRQSRYRFPRGRLQAGRYQMTIRAVGYDLVDPGLIEVTPDKPAEANLKLVPTHDLASQLTNAEIVMSVPGTDQQKKSLECVVCHTLKPVITSRYDAKAWPDVLYRMANYAEGSTDASKYREKKPFETAKSSVNPQLLEYLSSINLSSVDKWKYEFKTLPRPTGKGTAVIITEYDLPRSGEAEPHDAAVDPEGYVWYTDGARPFLGRLDPRTAEVKEYPVPIVKPGFPTGSCGIDFDKDGNPWIAMLYQGAIGKFDKKTDKFTVWSIPPQYNTARSLVGLIAVPRDGTGKVWFGDHINERVHSLDPQSGAIATYQVFPAGTHGSPFLPMEHLLYGIYRDSKNNGYFSDLRGGNIGRIEAKTGEVKLFPLPTPDAGPREGFVDSQDRLWFAEYKASKVGVFDTKTQQFQEWSAPSPLSRPYQVVRDKNGQVWGGGMSNDRVFRFDPKTQRFTEYLLPSATNIRRVDVDNSTNPVSFWVGSNFGGKLVKVEPLE
jgi:virginiamycin B lyase